MTKKDYMFGLIVGFVVGLLILLPIANMYDALHVQVTFFVGLISVLFFSFAAPFCLFVLGFLGKKKPALVQFGKFACVGVLNTLLNLGVMNLLMILTEIKDGIWYSAFVAIGFIVASTNSYFWNKFWSFESKTTVSGGEYTKFLFFTFVGMLINTGVASLVVNVISVPQNISAGLWANIGGLFGTAASFMWNFLSYRLVIFKSKNEIKN